MRATVRRRAANYGRQSANKSKSIKEQLVAGRQTIDAQGWEHAVDYKDGVSASRYTTKVRSNWDKVVAGIKEGRFNVLVLWESSRGDRTLLSWVGFLELCRERDVLIHVVMEDYTYDLSKPRDMKALAEAGVNSAFESDMLSVRLRRGLAGAAKEGKPHGGRTPYGYRRTYSPTSGELDGLAIAEPEASVVREIFDRLSRGFPVSTVAEDLTARGIRAPLGAAWSRRTVRRVATSLAYRGVRTHKGTRHQGVWEPLIGAELFETVQQILLGEDRKTTRPGRQVHLLSYLALCDLCGSPLNRQKRTKYACRQGCVSVEQQVMDLVVTEILIGRIGDPAVAAALLAGDADDKAREAGDEAAQLRIELDGWRLSAARGQTSPASLSVIERDLTARIEQAEQASARSTIPPALRALLESQTDVRARWELMPVPARRTVVRALCEIRMAKAATGLKGDAHRRASTLRLAPSRWAGEETTWGDLWREQGLAVGA